VIDQIDSILDEFPFDRVWQAMRAVGWKYGIPGSLYYPTFTDLRRTAKRLLETAAEEQTRASTGGFEAMYSEGVLALRFVLATASYDLWEAREGDGG